MNTTMDAKSLAQLIERVQKEQTKLDNMKESVTKQTEVVNGVRAELMVLVGPIVNTGTTTRQRGMSDAVLRILQKNSAAGPVSTDQISQELKVEGFDPKNVSAVLVHLTTKGKINKIAKGMYHIA